MIEYINTIKFLIYKESPLLLEKVNFEDDSIFLEPLLFAYFNSKKDSLFSNELLEEILQGYFIQTESLKLNHSYNKKGVAYIPNSGYFKNNKQIDTILTIDGFEIIKECHPVLEKYFIEYYRGHIVDEKPWHNSVWEENYKELEKAILILKEYVPKFYEELIFGNKKIYLHDNPKILNFTSIETFGMLYFYVIGNNNIIYFIEELIHQGSHNYLYNVISNF
jgi:hypothetical protein